MRKKQKIGLLSLLALLAAIQSNGAYAEPGCETVFNDLTPEELGQITDRNKARLKLYSTSSDMIRDRAHDQNRSITAAETKTLRTLLQKIQFCQKEGTFNMNRKRPAVYIVPEGCARSDDARQMNKKMDELQAMKAAIFNEAYDKAWNRVFVYTEVQSAALLSIHSRLEECISLAAEEI